MEFSTNDGPYIKDKNSTFHMTKNFLIALLPIILFAFYKNGLAPYLNGDTNLFGLFKPLIFIFTTAMTSLITETIFAFALKKKTTKEELLDFVKTSYSFIPGVLIALIIPLSTSIYVLIFGTMLAIFLGKLLYGGFGYNIFNPALLGRLAIVLFFSSTISYLNPSEVDAITSATPLTNLFNFNYIGTYQELVAPYGSIFNMFFGFIPGTLGETSAFLCLISLIFLVKKKVISYKIPVFYIGTVFVMSSIMALVFGLGIWYPFFTIFSGGLFFGAIFMATDPVTSPVSKNGPIIYGILLGIFTIAFRFLTPYPEGVSTAILFMNIFVVLVDRIANYVGFNKIFRVLIISSLAIVVILLPFDISSDIKERNDSVVDLDFKVIGRINEDSNIIYNVEHKGFSSYLEANIVLDGDCKILTIDMTQKNDSYFFKIDNLDFIESLITSQNDLNNLDTVSGATRTSSSLIKMASKTITECLSKKGDSE